MRATDDPRTARQAQDIVDRRLLSRLLPTRDPERVVITAPEVKVPYIGKGGFGQWAIALAPGETKCLETGDGKIVEFHRLGSNVTWRRR